MAYKKCIVCSSVFYARPSRKNRGKYCSRKCYKEDLKKRVSIFFCEQCGKRVERPRWRITTKPMKHRFCSLKCYSVHRSLHREEYPNYYRPNRIWVAKTLTEDALKKEYIDNKLRILDIAKKFETSYSLVQKRLKKFGLFASRSRYSVKNSEAHWRRHLNKKHNHTCQVCGWDKDNCDVAHKRARKLGGEYREDNLYLLCPNCHRLYDRNKLKI